jgi:hypothetical protein
VRGDRTDPYSIPGRERVVPISVPRVRREGEQVRLGMPLLPIVACTVGVFMGTNGNFWLTGAAFFALMAIDIGNSNG